MIQSFIKKKTLHKRLSFLKFMLKNLNIFTHVFNSANQEKYKLYAKRIHEN